MDSNLRFNVLNIEKMPFPSQQRDKPSNFPPFLASYIWIASWKDVSHEKNPGWLGFIRDENLPSYIGIIQ